VELQADGQAHDRQNNEDGGASHVGDKDGQERQDNGGARRCLLLLCQVFAEPQVKEAHGPVDDEEIETRDIEEQLLALQLNALLEIIPARISADEL